MLVLQMAMYIMGFDTHHLYLIQTTYLLYQTHIYIYMIIYGIKHLDIFLQEMI